MEYNLQTLEQLISEGERIKSTPVKTGYGEWHLECLKFAQLHRVSYDTFDWILSLKVEKADELLELLYKWRKSF